MHIRLDQLTAEHVKSVGAIRLTDGLVYEELRKDLRLTPFYGKDTEARLSDEAVYIEVTQVDAQSFQEARNALEALGVSGPWESFPGLTTAV